MRTTLTCLLAATTMALAGCGSDDAKTIDSAKGATRAAAHETTRDDTPDRDLRHVEYAGEDGETALELLEDNGYDVTTTHSSIGDYVTAIGDVEATRTTYWSYYVDGKLPNVGADAFTTKDGQRIEWKFEG
jgi:hypothetical protein